MEAQPHAAFDCPAAEAPELPRTETGLRLLYTVVFVGVLQIVAVIACMLVLFQLIFALATRENPHPRLKAFGDALAGYTRQVLSYVTYNENEPPFPFADLPDKTRS